MQQRRITQRASKPSAVADEARGDTKARILDAAFRRLAREGYGALSMREIAKDAGINHALINYHFQTKDQLVIAVLDAANQRLLYRQRQMYRSPGGFAAKWAQARRFYENDLASGFVRVQAELWAASLSNPGLREQFLPRINEWRKVIFDATRESFNFYRIELPEPFSPEVIACWITEFWVGMEMSMLIGTSDTEAHHRAALDAVQRLLEDLDRRAVVKSKRKSGRNVRVRRRMEHAA